MRTASCTHVSTADAARGGLQEHSFLRFCQLIATNFTRAHCLVLAKHALNASTEKLEFGRFGKQRAKIKTKCVSHCGSSPPAVSRWRERLKRWRKRMGPGGDLPSSFTQIRKRQAPFQCIATEPGQAYLQCSSLLRSPGSRIHC